MNELENLVSSIVSKKLGWKNAQVTISNGVVDVLYEYRHEYHQLGETGVGYYEKADTKVFRLTVDLKPVGYEVVAGKTSWLPRLFWIALRNLVVKDYSISSKEDNLNMLKDMLD